MEALLRFPQTAGNLEDAHTLALSIARDAPDPGTADLGVKVIAAINELRLGKEASASGIGLQKALWRLRLAVQSAGRP